MMSFSKGENNKVNEFLLQGENGWENGWETSVPGPNAPNQTSSRIQHKRSFNPKFIDFNLLL